MGAQQLYLYLICHTYIEAIEIKMSIGESVLAPPSKRRKSDNHDEAIQICGLPRIPDCTQAAVDWCPSIFGPLLADTRAHDVTFKTSDGGSVSAHRLMVAAGSPVFHAMLYGDMKESSQMEIELPTVDSETLSNLLAFVYTGKVNVQSNCFEKVLDAAHYFNISFLEDKLIDFIVDSLNLTNIFAIISFARNSKFPRLFRGCLSFIYDHADKVALSANFKHLSSEIVLTFCKSSELRIKEVKLFLAVVKWCNHQDQLPKTVSNSIFQEIRYPLISEAELINAVRPTRMADPVLYTAALEYHLLPGKYEGPVEQITVRKYPPLDYKYINLSVIENDNNIEIFKTGKRDGVCAILVYPTQEQPIHFKIVVQQVNTVCSCIYLATRSYCSRRRLLRGNDFTGGIGFRNLHEQQIIDGTISIKGSVISTTINQITRITPKYNVIYFCIYMNHLDDFLQFSFT